MFLQIIGISYHEKDPGRCIPNIFLLHSWGSLFGSAAHSLQVGCVLPAIEHFGIARCSSKGSTQRATSLQERVNPTTYSISANMQSFCWSGDVAKRDSLTRSYCQRKPIAKETDEATGWQQEGYQKRRSSLFLAMAFRFWNRLGLGAAKATMGDSWGLVQ